MTTAQSSKWKPVTTVSELKVGDFVHSTTMINSQKYIGVPRFEEYNCQLEGIVTEIPSSKEPSNNMENNYDWDPASNFAFETVKIMVSNTMEIKNLVSIPGTSGSYTIEKKVTSYEK